MGEVAGNALRPLRRLLGGLSDKRVETKPNMVLALDAGWKRHEDYLASLASKYRSAVKNEVLEPIRTVSLKLRGFDSAAAQHPLYLRLLHASVADAIALGARELSLGRTALEPKARLGAKPQAMTVWARHRQPVFNKLAGRLLTLAHHDEAPECHPFKKAAGAAL